MIYKGSRINNDSFPSAWKVKGPILKTNIVDLRGPKKESGQRSVVPVPLTPGRSQVPPAEKRNHVPTGRERNGLFKTPTFI